MLPIFPGVLGFDDTDCLERREQQRVLRHFWRYAARAFHPSLEKRRLPLPETATELLVGDMNLVYEIPEVCGVDGVPGNYRMIGPVVWRGWEALGEPCPWEKTDNPRTLYLNFGALPRHDVMERVVEECLRSGVRLLISSGREGARLTSDRVYCRPLLPPSNATALADAVIGSGGVGVCYTDLAHAVPTLVIPTQPEQATNGHNLERAGCGRILWDHEVFLGDSSVYLRNKDFGRLDGLISEMLETPNHRDRLQEIQRRLRAYDAREMLLAAVKDLT
jgi:UDP:flavonoid glycosyltransferase YjiC (YdhE family)